MAASETLYTLGSTSEVVLARGRDQVSEVVAELDGTTVAPTAGTYTLVAPNGTTISDPAVTIVDSVATVTIPAADLGTTVAYGVGYYELWTLTLDGVPRSFRRAAVVGRFELHPPVRQLHIVQQEYPDLLTQFAAYPTGLGSIMDGAWSECLRYLWRQGIPSDIVVNPSDVFDWYRHVGLERVFRALLQMQDNLRWDTLRLYHLDAAKAARDGLRVQLDPDRSGDATAEPTPVTKQVHPNRSGRANIGARWR